MLQKALALTSQAGPSQLSSLEEKVQRTKPSRLRGSIASAGFSAEEDFELNEDFLDVFTRASERLAGFVVGCTLIGVAWLAFSLL
ncbi:MAG TPA: hypothetical protein VHT03_10820 [Rhizomicrobium sp.]|jgi:hypothetical protein|nr:hypothetical protein [Rhizomicrobium sp.]